MTEATSEAPVTEPHAPIRDTLPTQDERTWALAAHLGGPAGLLLSAGLFGFAVPLVVWLAKREESAFVDRQGKEALNFQITLFLIHVAALAFVLLTLGVGLLIVWPFFLLLWFFELVVGIVAALKSYQGEPFRYPLILRLI